MTQIVIDELLRSKLNGCQEEVAFVDDKGQPLGHFVPEGMYRKLLYAWAESQCPYSKEELDRFKKETGGRPLSEIWKSLGVK
jgi:hypothetical protein